MTRGKVLIKQTLFLLEICHCDNRVYATFLAVFPKNSKAQFYFQKEKFAMIEPSSGD